MSNIEPSAIVLQCIPCMRGLYRSRSDGSQPTTDQSLAAGVYIAQRWHLNPMRTKGTNVLLCVALSMGLVPRVADAGPTRTRITLPADQPLTFGSPQLLAISPDGQDIVYASNLRLYRRRVNGQRSNVLAGTDSRRGVFNPVLAADGRSIAFWSADEQALKRVPSTGGTPTTICQASGILGASWSPDDEIVFGAGQQGVMRVSARGGTPQVIATMKAGEFAAMPQMLPGGEAVLFTVLTQPRPGTNPWDSGQIVVESLRTHERRTVVAQGSHAQYLLTKRLVYGFAGRLLAAPFDLTRLEVTGAAVPLADDVRVAGPTQFAVSSNGTAAWIRGRQGQVQLEQVDLDGHRTLQGLLPDTTFAIRVSPNGQQVTFDTFDGTVWVADLTHLPARRPLASDGNSRFPMWSGDGLRILFTSERNGVESLVWQPADGSGPADVLTTPARSAESWLPGSQAFSFITFKAGGDYDVSRYSVPDKTVTRLVELPGSAQHSSRFSPDGRWLAYGSNETGRFEVFVEPVPTTGVRVQLTREGGGHPLWSPDGRTLYFDRAGRLFSVRFEPNPSAPPATPVPLPISGFIQGEARRQYDSMPDGRQFLMLFPAASQLETLRGW
jgi:Tol biopolymer transport system component